MSGKTRSEFWIIPDKITNEIVKKLGTNRKVYLSQIDTFVSKNQLKYGDAWGNFRGDSEDITKLLRAVNLGIPNGIKIKNEDITILNLFCDFGCGVDWKGAFRKYKLSAKDINKRNNALYDTDVPTHDNKSTSGKTYFNKSDADLFWFFTHTFDRLSTENEDGLSDKEKAEYAIGKQLDEENFESAKIKYLDYFQKEKLPNGSDHYATLGAFEEKLGNYENAITFFKIARTISPDDIRFVFGLAKCFKKSNKINEAYFLLEDSTYLISNSIDVWLHISYYELLGDCYILLHDIDKAIRNLEKAFLITKNGEEDLKFGFAVIATKLFAQLIKRHGYEKNKKRIMETEERILKLFGETSPPFSSFLNAVAENSLLNEEYTAALKYYRYLENIILKIEPFNKKWLTAIWANISYILAIQKDYIQSISTLHTAIDFLTIDDENSLTLPILYDSLSSVYFNSGDIESGLLYKNKAITLAIFHWGEESEFVLRIKKGANGVMKVSIK